ncbi:MAG: cystathionine beta-synthase [Nannocystaceae bacterium]|nr:PLP-dependent transferase [bacterium]
MPADWLDLTTHRLDIYDEPLAKTQFLERFEALARVGSVQQSALAELPTAFDYIRLGHPLSCVLEWAIAETYGLQARDVIAFSSRTAPLLAVLRKNLGHAQTLIAHQGELPSFLDEDALRRVYGYSFETIRVQSPADIPSFAGRIVFLAETDDITRFDIRPGVDFHVNVSRRWGSIIVASGDDAAADVSEIQHTRRRETIAMTPVNCLAVLRGMVGKPAVAPQRDTAANEARVLDTIRDITGTHGLALVGSSGLSVQYAIVMGLIDDALTHHAGKPIRLVVPTNCYGGTNDQARRVASCRDDVEVVDLAVDGGRNMVESTDEVLQQVADEDAVPLIIAEIPTNPRVEVPDLEALRDVLCKPRRTASGAEAVAPVFVLDQTFCPNVRFLGEGDVLAPVQTIAYVSGSKFPSGGRCTAGYCVANVRGERFMPTIGRHLALCDNEATEHQLEVLAEQLPSMLERIHAAYLNTRDFVNFVHEVLPQAKINFVSEELASQGFTPSVFSLDLPTRGDTEEEREAYKRSSNLTLIESMIREIPDESKFCVSYGQLKGCYWTVPATSTQGTTKEGDKDYIVRVAVSPALDLERHKAVFRDFVARA